MSYKALYRKYRPQKFSEVIGQNHILSTLINIVKIDKVSHAYLFSGPRGTGKTSVAHIFANEINKVDINDKSHQNNFDIIEVDAASHNGVTEIRKLIDNANYLPTIYRYKIYIIDEIHMLTRGAFNALLKTLEEPPSHLIFILATTEPHKIPTTILSRTQRFNFKKIDNKLMTKNLKFILNNERISFEEEAIKLIVNLAQGGMRDCLSIADQVASYGNNKISFVGISQVFGIISVFNQIKIVNLVYEKKTKDLLIIVNDFINNGIDVERLINSLIDIVKDFIIYKKTYDIELCSTLTISDINLLKISIDFAYDIISELVDSIKYFQFSEMKKQILEISLLKLCSIDKNLNIKKTVDTKKFIEDTKISYEDENDDFISEQTNVKNKIKIKNQNNEDKNNEDKNNEDIKKSFKINVNDSNLNQFKRTTKEIDVKSYLGESHSKAKMETNQLKELINYLQHANKNKLNQFKSAMPNIINWIDKVENKNYITLLQNAKIISGGNNFIIISSDDKYLISSLKKEVNKKEFIDLVSDILKEQVNIIVISKQEFKELKEEWKSLVSNNNLPPKYPIKTFNLDKKSKTNVEQYGKKLFGKLFENKEE